MDRLIKKLTRYYKTQEEVYRREHMRSELRFNDEALNDIIGNLIRKAESSPRLPKEYKGKASSFIRDYILCNTCDDITDTLYDYTLK